MDIFEHTHKKVNIKELKIYIYHYKTYVLRSKYNFCVIKTICKCLV